MQSLIHDTTQAGCFFNQLMSHFLLLYICDMWVGELLSLESAGLKVMWGVMAVFTFAGDLSVNVLLP